MTPKVDGFFDPTTNSISYVVSDHDTRRAAVIDPVLDFDPASGRTATDSADRLIAAVERDGLAVDWILETHVHADHITAAPYVQKRLGGRTGIGAGVSEVRKTFGTLFNIGDELAADGSHFDRLFDNGDTLSIGGIAGRAMLTPGHTPACACYVFGDAAFVGDTMFMPDSGTARADFPGGCAETLYDSLRRILSLPADTRLFMCHDYGAGGTRDFLLGDHRRRTAPRQHTLPRRRESGELCRRAYRTRRGAPAAAADRARGPGQYPGADACRRRRATGPPILRYPSMRFERVRSQHGKGRR